MPEKHNAKSFRSFIFYIFCTEKQLTDSAKTYIIKLVYFIDPGYVK